MTTATVGRCLRSPDAHPGHFWRPPFTVAWCDGGHKVRDEMPCGRIQPGTWAIPCVVEGDHDEHRTAERSSSGTYHYWVEFPGGFAIYEARQHDGWRKGAPRDPDDDDPRQQAVRHAEEERQARRERRLAGLRLANRLCDLVPDVAGRPTDEGGVALAPDEVETLIEALGERFAEVEG